MESKVNLESQQRYTEMLNCLIQIILDLKIQDRRFIESIQARLESGILNLSPIRYEVMRQTHSFYFPNIEYPEYEIENEETREIQPLAAVTEATDDGWFSKLSIAERRKYLIKKLLSDYPTSPLGIDVAFGRINLSPKKRVKVSRAKKKVSKKEAPYEYMQNLFD